MILNTIKYDKITPDDLEHGQQQASVEFEARSLKDVRIYQKAKNTIKKKTLYKSICKSPNCMNMKY